MRNTSGTCEEHVRNMWGARQEHVRNTSGTCKEHVRSRSGTCEEHVKNMWGTCEEHVRNMWETCQEHVRNMWGTRQEHVRNMWRTCRATQRPAEQNSFLSQSFDKSSTYFVFLCVTIYFLLFYGRILVLYLNWLYIYINPQWGDLMVHVTSTSHNFSCICFTPSFMRFIITWNFRISDPLNRCSAAELQNLVFVKEV